MLPTHPTEPQVDLGRLRILIHGEPKIGKSTFCSQFPRALFLDTENGLIALRASKIIISNWLQFRGAINDILSETHIYETIIVDTIDNAWLFCQQFYCKKAGIDYEGDQGYGKGFSMVMREFRDAINMLITSPYGLVMTSHSCDREIDDGVKKRTKTVPSLSGKPREFITGSSTIIGYACLEKRERRLYCQPTGAFEAGDRTGRLPESIPLQYAELAKYFPVSSVAQPHISAKIQAAYSQRLAQAIELGFTPSEDAPANEAQMIEQGKALRTYIDIHTPPTPSAPPAPEPAPEPVDPAEIQRLLAELPEAKRSELMRIHCNGTPLAQCTDGMRESLWQALQYETGPKL